MWPYMWHMTKVTLVLSVCSRSSIMISSRWVSKGQLASCGLKYALPCTRQFVVSALSATDPRAGQENAVA